MRGSEQSVYMYTMSLMYRESVGQGFRGSEQSVDIQGLCLWCREGVGQDRG